MPQVFCGELQGVDELLHDPYRGAGNNAGDQTQKYNRKDIDFSGAVQQLQYPGEVFKGHDSLLKICFGLSVHPSITILMIWDKIVWKLPKSVK